VSRRWRIGISPFGTTRDGAAEVARIAVDGGIDTLWVGDGLLVVDDFPRWAGGLEAFTHLAWLAGRHPGIRLGVGAAVLPLRDPLWTVRQAATLAHLTDGGVVLGLCPGFWARELVFRGLDPTSRGRRFDALLPVVGHHDGGRISPVAPPGSVAVWLAGGRRTFDRALRHGRPFQASRMSPEALAPWAAEWFARGGGTLAVRVRMTVDEATADTPGDAVDWAGVSGDAASVAETIGRYLDLGVTDISIVPGHDDETSMRTVTALVDDVLPAVRARPVRAAAADAS
jgi:alkanesulfonate monooxygenase SsuD/methylene tetrahydromethanopterin reductase-like flavin-dependent oxidoreductase (luciferase family)